MNIKNVVLLPLLFVGFAFATIDKTNIEKVIDEMKNLQDKMQQKRNVRYSELLSAYERLVQISERNIFRNTKSACWNLGYRKHLDNLSECPHFEELTNAQNAFVGTMTYQEWEPLLIEDASDFYAAELAKSIVYHHNTCAGELKVDGKSRFGDFEALRRGLDSKYIDSYVNESGVETETGKATLIELMTATRKEVANIIDELEKQQ